MRNFPAQQVPSGWFMIGWSSEFPHGVSKPLSYFGEDLVAYRGESGEQFYSSETARDADSTAIPGAAQ